MPEQHDFVSTRPKSSARPEVVELLADVFQHTGDVTMETSREHIKRWDSLRHVALVLSLESTFGIKLSMDEMAEIVSVRDIHAVLTRHGA